MSHPALRSRPDSRSLGRHNARGERIDVDVRLSLLEIKRADQVDVLPRDVKRPKVDGNEWKTPALSRRPGPGAARCAAGKHVEGQTRPGDPGDVSASWAAVRGALRLAGARASRAAKACPTCASWVKVQRCATCRPTRWPWSASTITSKPPATTGTRTARCSGRSKTRRGGGTPTEPLTHGAVYHRVLRKHAKAAGIDGKSFGPHALRATAATNALDRGADLAQGAGVVGARQRVDHPALRPAPLPARRQPYVSRRLLRPESY